MKRLILISILSSFVSCAVAAELVVSPRVVQSGLMATRAVFNVEARLTNTSSVPVSYAMMSCSWRHEWRVEPHSIFEIKQRPCFGNFPVELYLQAHESATFKFQVLCRGTNVPLEVKRMKVGFLVVPWTGSKDLFVYGDRFKQSENVVWSDEFELPPVGKQSIPEWNE